ncbi:hypothetical protein [Gymnodinialimonas hymeniacidonis]|uniref:hypothetical protein n=1 Tax=Gymnodinialimonas hymeniacidonis TaxID=3126508 RepID=UPI0034C6CE07
MKRYALPLGFGFIGLAMLTIALILYLHMARETRIGERLIDDGVATDALLVTAEYVERLSCRGGTIKVCNRSDYALGQIVYLVDDRRAVNDVTLSEEDFASFEAGEEVRISIVYLPDDPQEIEGNRGDRFISARSDDLTIIVSALFGIVFAAIGGIAALVIRKQTPV